MDNYSDFGNDSKRPSPQTGLLLYHTPDDVARVGGGAASGKTPQKRLMMYGLGDKIDGRNIPMLVSGGVIAAQDDYDTFEELLMALEKIDISSDEREQIFKMLTVCSSGRFWVDNHILGSLN